MTVLDALKPKSRKKGAAKAADQLAASDVPSSSTSKTNVEDAGSSSATKDGVAAPASVAGGEQSDRIKGPVEEVIAKRARQLAKKIQRFKGYASSGSTLNADQKAAIATLPALEAVYNELQELTKPGGPVEVAELNEAARVRDMQKDHATTASSTGSSSSASALASPLAHFLRLHSLLHPARPSDHANLTFGRIELPANLQEEVQATDVLRVGRMYEDLRAGGESGAAVLEGLARGPAGKDEENDHIHHLLAIIAESSPEADMAQAEPAPSQVEEGFELHAVPEITEPSSAAEPTEPAPSASAAASGGPINFLQQDEVNTLRQPEVDPDQSYEIIQPMEPHQTSGQQPPLDFGSTAPPAPAAAAESFNWAEDEDEHHATAAIPSSEQVQGDAAAVELAQPIDANATAQPAADPAILEPETSAVPEAPVSGAQPTATAIMTGEASIPEANTKSGSNAQRKPRQPQQPKNLPRTMVDEDGFEMKVRNRAPQQQQQGSGRGGRGGRGGSNGERGPRGGRGGPGGVNRGPSSRGPRPAQTAVEGAAEAQTSTGAPRAPRNNSQRGGRGGPRQGQANQRASQAPAAAVPAAAAIDA